MQQFTTPLTPDQIHRRAGGRRRHNRDRRFARSVRRLRVFELFWSLQEPQLNAGVLPKRWGLATRIAALLGVSRATVSRDLQAMPRFFGTGPHGPWWPDMARKTAPRRSAFPSRLLKSARLISRRESAGRLPTNANAATATRREGEPVRRLAGRVAKLWERRKAEGMAIPETASGRLLLALQLLRRGLVRAGGPAERLARLDALLARVQARVSGGTDWDFEAECRGNLAALREATAKRLERQKAAGDQAPAGT